MIEYPIIIRIVRKGLLYRGYSPRYILIFEGRDLDRHIELTEGRVWKNPTIQSGTLIGKKRQGCGVVRVIRQMLLVCLSTSN